MSRIIALSTMFFTVFVSALSFAQQSKPVLPGAIKGAVRDTVHKFVLKAATISVYKQDSTLINYTITNNYGDFILKGLPVSTPLKIEVSHMGYALFEQHFSIAADQPTNNLGTLIMKMKETTLKEVEVRIPPVTMNNDTLEINPAAFKLDPNARIEDVLKRTPGVVLWGDGKITVNGREVKSVLVEGRQFFGGDSKIALQNLPKNSVEKVQVYREKNEANPLDSTLTMNLKLKANKRNGMFGKVGAGYGTDKRYEADGSLNYYTPKLQLGLVGASNNINKMVGSAKTILDNSTFKGVGADISYQPDFRTNGISKATAIGATFKYDFIENPKWESKSSLAANYLTHLKDFENVRVTQNTTTIGDANQQYNQSSTSNTNTNNTHAFDSQFNYARRYHRLDVSQRYNAGDYSGTNQSTTNSFNNEGQLLSSNTSTGENSNQTKTFNLTAKLNRNYYSYPPKKFKLFNSLEAGYTLDVNQNFNDSRNLSDFRSFVSSDADRLIDRKYHNTSDGVMQRINFALPQVQSLLKYVKWLRGISLAVKNGLYLSNRKITAHVQDLQSSTGQYAINNYLTNRLTTDVIEDVPEVVLRKSFYKNLSNRYYKSISFEVTGAGNFTVQRNHSDKSFQNINRNYNAFLPKASISLNNNQYGSYNQNASLSYTTEISIPSIDQLAPLTDSTNMYNLRRGNLLLKAERVKRLMLRFAHYDEANKNTFNVNVNAGLSLTDANISDSVIVDAQNKRIVYAVNIDGAKNATIGVNLNKAYQLKAGQLQLRLNSNLDWGKVGAYTNGALNFSNVFNGRNTLALNFNTKQNLAVEASTSYSPYISRQLAFGTNYKGAVYANSLSASYNLYKKVTLSSNVTFNRNISPNTDPINFAIWNASFTYRFLKGNNAELKLSALDLLKQNTNILNFISPNSTTTGTQTVLKQYFMTTFSYYPQFFGKTRKAK